MNLKHDIVDSNTHAFWGKWHICINQQVLPCYDNMLFFLFILSPIAYLPFLSYLIHCIYLIRSRDHLFKVQVMWYDITGTLVPIKGPGFHRIPGHSMGFYFLPCDVIHLCLFGHFLVVYIGHLYRVYNLRIDLV